MHQKESHWLQIPSLDWEANNKPRNITYLSRLRTLISCISGQVKEITAPDLDQLDVNQPPTGENIFTIAWISVMGTLLIISIIGVYFKRKLAG